MNESVLKRIDLESSLSKAVQRGELRLHYQAQFDVRSGNIVGVEALLRWLHPAHGLLAPVRFIPLAEENGSIVEIGEWVLRTACSQAKAWQRPGEPAIRLACNLTSRQFREGNLDTIVARVLKETGLDPALLELEITENLLLEDREDTARILSEFKTLGATLAVDDFGTGYSSLTYLRRFPVDCLKIDRSFLTGVPKDTENVSIVRAVIALAKSLDLRIVGEGVETSEQLQFLRAEGCHECQGFLLAKPETPEKISSILQSSRRTAGAFC